MYAGGFGMGVLWMVAKSIQRSVQKPWIDSISQRKYQASNGFSHGFKVVRNGFRPSAVCCMKVKPKPDNENLCCAPGQGTI